MVGCAALWAILVGGTFEGSMTKNFEDEETFLYEIADTPVIARNKPSE